MDASDLEHRLSQLRLTVPDPATGQSIDPGRAWLEFQQLRSGARRSRRVRVVAAATAAAAAVIAAVLVIPSLNSPLSRPGRPHPAVSSGHPSRKVPVNPASVVARIPVSGAGMVVQEGGNAWTIASTGASRQSLQLLRISLRSNQVTLRLNIGHDPDVAVAAGAGKVWMTTPYARTQGQIARVNPATGQIMTTLHLAAGKCSYLAYSAGQLWVHCDVAGSSGSQFLRVDPVTGRVELRSGTLPRFVGPYAVAPDAVWLVDKGRVEGLVWTGSQMRVVTVHDPAYPVSFGLTDSLVYASGFVWAFTTDESIAKIRPLNGHVVRLYTYATYDPKYDNGLNFFTTAQGSLWFLDDGSQSANAVPVTGVLRVSMTTGRPLGFVPIGAGRPCGEPCVQFYYTKTDSMNGAIWVPTSRELVRIDPARVPG